MRGSAPHHKNAYPRAAFWVQNNEREVAMAFTVEYLARGSARDNEMALAAQRAIESFATEAEAIAFVSGLPPMRDPVLVREDGERIRGPALSIHLVNWQRIRQRL
jgi:hypothetical protein